MFKFWVVLKHPIRFIRILYQDFVAYQKGQIRLCPRIAVNGQFITRGAVYSVPHKSFGSKAKGGVIVNLKVTRADGTVEQYVADANGQRRIK